MQSARVDMFLSCSFQDEDQKINDFFIAICSALDIKCINVDGAYDSVPPEVARRQIDESLGLIAIATKRNELENGKYLMPSSVQEEIAMAYGKNIPILLFSEDCISIDGMKSNYGTYMSFCRDNLYEKDTLEKVIRSIHDFKMQVVSPNDLVYDHDIPEIMADYYKQIIELKMTPSGYSWSYSTSKKIQFLNAFKRKIPITFWATVPVIIPESATIIKPEITLDSHSRNLTIKLETVKETADCSKTLLKIEPHPEKDDFIEYTSYVESPYFNPIYSDNIEEPSPIEIENINYSCMDGFIPLQRTKLAILEFRFPRGYGLHKNNITFFVGSYTDEVDYIVESEMSRTKVNISEIGGSLTLKMEIESPLLRHMYGFAWNPPQRSGDTD